MRVCVYALCNEVEMGDSYVYVQYVVGWRYVPVCTWLEIGR